MITNIEVVLKYIDILKKEAQEDLDDAVSDYFTGEAEGRKSALQVLESIIREEWKEEN